MVALPWCTHTLAFIALPVANVYNQGFNVSLAEHHFVKILLWQQKTVPFFNL
jgi:hypothetical protein